MLLLQWWRAGLARGKFGSASTEFVSLHNTHFAHLEAASSFADAAISGKMVKDASRKPT